MMLDYALLLHHLNMTLFCQVNNGVLNPDVLEAINSTYDWGYTSDGNYYEGGMYFHSRFPNHEPVYCATFYNEMKTSGIFMCALLYNTRFALPVFNHYGEDGMMCNW